jgi:hypothetical protein
VHLAWSLVHEAVIMSRMGKDREEVRTVGDSKAPRRRQLQSRGDLPPPVLEGDFERAFADALGDILRHERRRAAA